MCEEAEFYLNDSLVTDLVGPSTITSLRDGFLRNCINLKSVVIPDSVTSIGKEAFNGCTQIESMTVPFIGENLQTMGSSVFAYFFNGYSLPSSLKTIAVTGGTKIGKNAFNGCKMTSITLADSITSIGDGAFLSCSNLTSIIIPSRVTYIDYNAFTYCSKLTDIRFAGNINQWNSMTRNSGWDYGVPATEVICSNGTVKIK